MRKNLKYFEAALRRLNMAAKAANVDFGSLSISSYKPDSRGRWQLLAGDQPIYPRHGHTPEAGEFDAYLEGMTDTLWHIAQQKEKAT